MTYYLFLNFQKLLIIKCKILDWLFYWQTKLNPNKCFFQSGLARYTQNQNLSTIIKFLILTVKLGAIRCTKIWLGFIKGLKFNTADSSFLVSGLCAHIVTHVWHRSWFASTFHSRDLLRRSVLLLRPVDGWFHFCFASTDRIQVYERSQLVQG